MKKYQLVRKKPFILLKGIVMIKIFGFFFILLLEFKD